MWKSFAAAQTMDILSIPPSRCQGRWRNWITGIQPNSGDFQPTNPTKRGIWKHMKTTSWEIRIDWHRWASSFPVIPAYGNFDQRRQWVQPVFGRVGRPHYSMGVQKVFGNQKVPSPTEDHVLTSSYQVVCFPMVTDHRGITKPFFQVRSIGFWDFGKETKYAGILSTATLWFVQIRQTHSIQWHVYLRFSLKKMAMSLYLTNSIGINKAIHMSIYLALFQHVPFWQSLGSFSRNCFRLQRWRSSALPCPIAVHLGMEIEMDHVLDLGMQLVGAFETAPHHGRNNEKSKSGSRLLKTMVTTNNTQASWEYNQYNFYEYGIWWP